MTSAALARVRYGADPELFLSTKKVPNPANKMSPVPITGLVGGTKLAPLDLTNKLPGWEGISRIPKGSKIQEDGPALEFNVAPAPDTRRLLTDCSFIMEAIHIFAKRKGLAVHRGSTATFSEEFRKTHEKAFVVGCDPDFCAYTQQQREIPEGIATSLTRHAGGHFHVGYDKDLVPPHIVVQFLDLMLGLPSVFADKQGLRRRFYGQAGSYRVKEYGVEYRTLSNFWVPTISLPAEYYRDLLRGAEVMMNRLITNMGTLEHLYTVIPWKDVQTAINTENEKMAEGLLQLGNKVNKELFQYPLSFVHIAKKYMKNVEVE